MNSETLTWSERWDLLIEKLNAGKDLTAEQLTNLTNTMSSLEMVFYLFVFLGAGFTIQQFRAGRLDKLSKKGFWNKIVEWMDVVLQSLAITAAFWLKQVVHGPLDWPLIKYMPKETMIEQFWISVVLGLIVTLIAYNAGKMFRKKG